MDQAQGTPAGAGAGPEPDGQSGPSSHPSPCPGAPGLCLLDSTIMWALAPMDPPPWLHPLPTEPQHLPLLPHPTPAPLSAEPM